MKSSILLIFLSILPFSLENSNSTNVNHRILSRKRRYLVFPEGSSLQLVYCLTMPSLGMGRIFTIGSTAAMAWILPHEPMVFLDKKHKKDNHAMEVKIPSHEVNSDHENDYEHDTDPQVLYPQYHSPHKQEIGSGQKEYYNFESYQRVDRPHVNYFPRPAHQQSVEPAHWHIYRRTRRSLYGKLEKLLSALSKDGRACIMKMICEVSQIADRKGSFMEEIVKVIFRIKTHNVENEDIYDAAANKSHNCNARYKSCPESFFGKL